MPPRFYIDRPLHAGDAFALPAGPARHVQVVRLQPGDLLTLFDGSGGEWSAAVERIGRSEVTVAVGARTEPDRELPWPVTLAVGMPANERMDTLIEKATELGVFAVQPLMCERSVLRLDVPRAIKKVLHWQAVAVAACEQSGRTRVPAIDLVCTLGEFLRRRPVDAAARWVLSLQADARAVATLAPPTGGVVCLSGPEGGLAPAEEAAAREAGFTPVSLGPRVLRADTAPLALLAHLALLGQLALLGHLAVQASAAPAALRPTGANP